AWWEGGADTPVDVEVWVNDEHRDTVSATQLRPSMARLKLPRGGYVGFQLKVNLSAGDRVQCRVAETGQWFPPGPRRVAVASN
ncbi:hypothetical protein DYI26_18985, partial [Halomonas litopenaei]|nr:hypothetical protein [Halomonas litopenaei]